MCFCFFKYFWCSKFHCDFFFSLSWRTVEHFRHGIYLGLRESSDRLPFPAASAVICRLFIKNHVNFCWSQNSTLPPLQNFSFLGETIYIYYVSYYVCALVLGSENHSRMKCHPPSNKNTLKMADSSAGSFPMDKPWCPIFEKKTSGSEAFDSQTKEWVTLGMGCPDMWCQGCRGQLLGGCWVGAEWMKWRFW